MIDDQTCAPSPDDETLVRKPGLYRIWELGEVLRTGTSFRIETAGWTEDGVPLIAIYQRADQTGATS